MGHKSLIMTLRYAHLSTGHTLAAIRLLDGEQTGTTDDHGSAHPVHLCSPPEEPASYPAILTASPAERGSLLCLRAEVSCA